MLDFDLSLEDEFQIHLVERQAKAVTREELETMLVQVTRLYLMYKKQTIGLLKEQVKNGRF